MLRWTREVKNHKIKLPASVLTCASVDPLAATTTEPWGSTAALTWLRRLISWQQIIANRSSLTGEIHSTLLTISTTVNCKSDTRARCMTGTTAEIIVTVSGAPGHGYGGGGEAAADWDIQ